ncbi:MarR family winged helix-turn-helix transcriptional regulator [Ktedonospora formicarum]|uniref:MarR family transcriptional regulator n=1 Tax=Ktedonospora formicarum TaxID=2778364 RepID=A0A8J3I6W5_9CHLR|nr:MarR family transcriptional regulator [Ktedonospora formicarum]GHO47940.1 MarR family transcriptional regulator [Ktedonospora formicarum]
MKHELNLGVRTWLHLNRVRFKVEQHLSKHLDQYDLTPAQFGVLAHLQAYPDISQQRLADLLFVTKGNIVGLLNRLECRDLVQRRPDPQDGRMHVVSLTERGRALTAQVVPEQERLVALHMAFSTPEDQHDLHQLLHALDRKLGPD